MKKLSILFIIISVIILSCGSSYSECSCKSKSKYLPDRVEGIPLNPSIDEIIEAINSRFEKSRIMEIPNLDSLNYSPNKTSINNDKFFINPSYWKDSTDFNLIPDSSIIVDINSQKTFIFSPLTIGLSGAKMSGDIIIPAGTKVKILDVIVSNSGWRRINKYKVKYNNHTGYIIRQEAELSKDMNRAKELVYKWIKNQYCHPDDIMIYNSEGPVLYKFKNQNLLEPFVFIRIDFWRRCDSGFYTKENKVFKIDSNFDLEIFNVDGFALGNIISK